MFCPNCGTNNEEGAAFCANCGTSLTVDVNQVQPEAPSAQAPVTETPVAQVDNQAQGAYTQQPVDGQQVYGEPHLTYATEQQAAAPAGAKPFKLPFKVTKKLIIISSAVAAVIVAFIVFLCVGSSVTNYKKTAEKYVRAVEECDWSTAYSLIKLPDSEFLTKDAFVTVHADAKGQKVGKVKVTDGFSSIGRLPGNKAVNVVYTTATGAETEDLLLTVTDKHYMLFFKKYKVSTEGVTVKDCQVSVPKGLALTINGVAVNESYKDAAATDKSSSYDVYKIPYLFNGSNEIKVTSDFTEEYTETIYPSYDEFSTSISSYDIKFSSDKVDSLKDQAKEDVTALINAAQKKSDFSSISDKVISSDPSSVKSEYKDLVDDFNTTYKQISNFKITTFNASLSETSYRVDSKDGCPTVKVSFKIGYSYTYKYKNDSKSYDKTNSNSSSYVYYKYENGKWKMSSVYLGIYF